MFGNIIGTRAIRKYTVIEYKQSTVRNVGRLVKLVFKIQINLILAAKENEKRIVKAPKT